MTILDRSIDKACEAYARKQSFKAERLAEKILASGVPFTEHSDFAEFAAINEYLVDVGVAK